jgi:hypothetical protein
MPSALALPCVAKGVLSLIQQCSENYQFRLLASCQPAEQAPEKWHGGAGRPELQNSSIPQGADRMHGKSSNLINSPWNTSPCRQQTAEDKKRGTNSEVTGHQAGDFGSLCSGRP